MLSIFFSFLKLTWNSVQNKKKVFKIILNFIDYFE